MAQLGYYKDGFTLDGSIGNNGLIKYTAAAVTILKGQALFDDTNGLATNATTAFAMTFIGVAAHGCTSGQDILVIPPTPDNRFWVKVEAAAVAAQTAIGTIVDLEQNDSVDLSDTTCLYWGFKIMAIDITTDAIASNTYGYVKGVFIATADES